MWPIPISTLFFELGSHIEPVAYLLVRVAGSELQVFFFLLPSTGVTDAPDCPTSF